MIDISSMDDEQVRGLARELATAISEKNLFVGAQFMADLEDALLEIREGVRERLAEHIPGIPNELEVGDVIEPGPMNRVSIMIDKITKTGQMVLRVLGPGTSESIILPSGVKLIIDPKRDYTGVIVKKDGSSARPAMTTTPSGRVFWSLPSYGVPEEFIRPNSYQDTELRPIGGSIEINGRMDVEAFEREVKRLLKEDNDK